MRQAIDNGGWFETAKAQKFEEETYWDGSNHISKATGSQWAHHVLYRTAKGGWVQHAWSQWEGSGESWTRITEAEAVDWLIQNGHTIPDGLESAASDTEV